jgi:hypothetical protein
MTGDNEISCFLGFDLHWQPSFLFSLSHATPKCSLDSPGIGGVDVRIRLKSEPRHGESSRVLNSARPVTIISDTCHKEQVIRFKFLIFKMLKQSSRSKNNNKHAQNSLFTGICKIVLHIISCIFRQWEYISCFSRAFFAVGGSSRRFRLCFFVWECFSGEFIDGDDSI